MRGKFFIVSFSFMVIAISVAGLYLAWRLRSQIESQTEMELLRHAKAARELLRNVSSDQTVKQLDRVADRIGEAISSRVTLIDPSGRVLGDSERTLLQIEKMENHSRRPEVLQAILRGKGISKRFSTTLGTRMLYVAVPCEGHGWHGVVRVAMPLDQVDAAVSKLRLLLLLAASLGIGTALVMSAAASLIFSRTLNRMVHSAKAVALGESSHGSIGQKHGKTSSMSQMAEELQRVVSALASERNRFEAVLKSMGEGILALDEQGKVTHANPAAYEVLSLSSPPEGKYLMELVRCPALARLVDKVKPQEVSSGEINLPGMEKRSILAKATSLGKDGGVVVVLHDVTELRKLEKMRQDFVANASHELRTPVSTILATTEALSDGALFDPVAGRDFLQALERNARRLSDLIDDLLDISRIDSGKEPFDICSVSIKNLSERVGKSFESRLGKHRFIIDIPSESDLFVLADEKALLQVVSNFVDNAIKYSIDNGRIIFRARQAHGHVSISVNDDGPGVPPKDRRRIFERFYRVDKGRSRQVGGTGLGLSIAKNLVEAMGGSIKYEEVIPRGSSFVVVLPKA